jgi:hypothetical protein
MHNNCLQQASTIFFLLQIHLYGQNKHIFSRQGLRIMLWSQEIHVALCCRAVYKISLVRFVPEERLPSI